jgi:hypothetical protein
VFYAEKKRTIYHTGFKLPSEGGVLTLVNPAGLEVDRVTFVRQEPNVSFGRYRDALSTFVYNPYPSPGSPNTDNGPIPPTGEFTGVVSETLLPGQRVQFHLVARDDVGLADVTLVYQRLDNPNSPVQRVVMYDDGLHNDGASGDAVYGAQLDHVLPTGAELQFYFEVADVANEVLFLPENPLFVRPGEPLRAYSLGIGYPRPPLEVSELVAFNSTGLEDETGQTPDWVEIRNCSAEPVALHGLSVCEGLGDQDRFDFPPDIFLHPGEALVLFADDQPSAGPWHAPFVLGREGGQVMITGRTPHGARTLVDSVRYGPQRADIAYARLGCGGLWRATTPTPGGQNIRGQWTGLVFQEDTTPYFTFGFATEPSYYYQVEYNDSLDPRDWLSLPPVPGTGIEQTISQPIVPNRFYRVRVDSLEGFGIR